MFYSGKALAVPTFRVVTLIRYLTVFKQNSLPCRTIRKCIRGTARLPRSGLKKEIIPLYESRELFFPYFNIPIGVPDDKGRGHPDKQPGFHYPGYILQLTVEQSCVRNNAEGTVKYIMAVVGNK